MTQAVEIRGLKKSFGELKVLRGIDLDVAEGEAVVLLGSSGSGKSTLLRCINFMEEPTEGHIRINGELIGAEQGGRMRYREADLCQLRTRIGMVFQHFNLFPHMTVLENVMEGQVVVLGRSKAEAEAKAMAQLARVGLEEKAPEYPASKNPLKLSATVNACNDEHFATARPSLSRASDRWGVSAARPCPKGARGRHRGPP